MDKKQWLENPEAAMAERWGSVDNCPHRDTVVKLVGEINALKPAIKQRTADKQRCAGRFGEAKAAGEDLAPLRRDMQAASSALAALEQQRKDLENQLWSLLEAGAAAPPALPPRFTLPAPAKAVAEPATVTTATDADAGAWDRYVAGHPLASLYHRYGWRRVIADSFGHETLYFCARDAGGALCGVLPMARLTSRLFGDFAVSMPFFNYGGPLADSAAIADRLLEHAAATAAERGLHHLEVRSTRPLNGWPARTDKVSMVLALPASGETLDAQLGAKVRAQIKRARQENPEVARGGIELLDDFYRVFAVNMRDLGTPVYGKGFFRNILTAWPEQARLVVLRLRGRPVAAAFLLGDRDLQEIPWASTLRSVNALNLNMLLYREVLQLSIKQGYGFFDFGRSSQDAGTFRFKKQWGAQPVQHHWHYWLAGGGPLPELKPDSPKFRFLVRCWQHLPVFVANRIGPQIVKYLP